MDMDGHCCWDILHGTKVHMQPLTIEAYCLNDSASRYVRLHVPTGEQNICNVPVNLCLYTYLYLYIYILGRWKIHDNIKSCTQMRLLHITSNSETYTNAATSNS